MTTTMKSTAAVTIGRGTSPQRSLRPRRSFQETDPTERPVDSGEYDGTIASMTAVGVVSSWPRSRSFRGGLVQLTRPDHPALCVVLIQAVLQRGH
jgi:hypothetical protein